ncbi:hypothetical protein Vau01_002050 [Virgisporangium aurantiacum]|uniref:Uncharacterized protein n=1 Tax=Virgisporangium aurantiacum TaxID=175570 RepID=A0A8J4DWB3_9ACTN|nr:hypothetical protein Vau01_002050 [Virgisporangium aurantiacum]
MTVLAAAALPMDRFGPPAALAAGTQAPAVAATTATAVVSTEISLLIVVLLAGGGTARGGRPGEGIRGRAGWGASRLAGRVPLHKNFIDL